MFDERAFIEQVEKAGPERLAEILTRPTVEQERALRAHLGEDRYQRMHSMALRRNITRSTRGGEPRKKGHVVVIHGIMGGELMVGPLGGGSGDLAWVNAFRIMRGWLERLRLDADGSSEANPNYVVNASGIMKRYYGELLLSLAENWNVLGFWFDWRKSLDTAADNLLTRINERFGRQEPVHIVAHSMGGLVARTFIKRQPERWRAMLDGTDAQKARRGGRLVMLGTPNHGSFSIPQVLTGVEGLVRKIAMLDFRHSLSDLLHVFNSFVGSYQMLPSPLRLPEVEFLYDPGTYAAFGAPVSAKHLQYARAHHDVLQEVVTPERLFYIAGFDQPTFDGFKKPEQPGPPRLDDTKGYTSTFDGDGRVPHTLGLLDGVTTYYVREEHGNLSSNGRILAALDGLLENGTTPAFHTDLAKAREAAGASTRTVTRAPGAPAAPAPLTPEEEMERRMKADEERLHVSLRRMGATRGAGPDPVGAPADGASAPRGADEQAPKLVSPEERRVEELITRGFLSYRGDEQEAGGGDEYAVFDPIEEACIEIGLAFGGIEAIHTQQVTGAAGAKYPIDVISVGHYIGVRPAQAELALDKSISADPDVRVAGEGAESLILTQYTDRGIIHGKLGQPFFLPDPREEGQTGACGRVLVIAGMGEPGRFGVPELTVLVRELCWALGRMGKKHLATVVIGTGAGNIKPRDAVSAWLDGIRRALTGSTIDKKRHVERITFVEFNPRRFTEFDELLYRRPGDGVEQQGDAIVYRREGLRVTYVPPGPEQRNAARNAEVESVTRERESRWQEIEDRYAGRSEADSGGDDDRRPPAPTRVTLGLDAARRTYRIGAITETASVPEREIKIDPAVVMAANDELAGEQTPRMQYERGRLLEELLIPDDLRGELYNNAPLVMLLDATTARIHWEMVAQPELVNSPAGGPGPGGDGDAFNPLAFLGTSRGFTRQLRTTFAPPPEPPPPARRVLRVLVVTDPAEDAHLPGAQEEGVAVADLFESFNTIHSERAEETRVEVKRLFGPLEATRTNVLRELMLRSYDVLHFAGHCVYRWGGNPTLSGWIFNAKRKELLTADELTRIDRVPKFVFSNACESGITPDRSQRRTADLAPSFAEAFFARGVANFVCTAWPVDDVAARVFALTLYSNLLGIKLDREELFGWGGASGPEKSGKEKHQAAQFMHEAMRLARIGIAEMPSGRLTWGAYQHYGNPYFQFFQDAKSHTSRPVTPRADAGSGAAGAARPGGNGASGTATQPAAAGTEAGAPAADAAEAEAGADGGGAVVAGRKKDGRKKGGRKG